MKQKFFVVERSQHVYLTFIAEAHDGLCSISTVDNSKGIIRITVPEGREAEVESFMDAMKAEIGMEEIEWPVS